MKKRKNEKKLKKQALEAAAPPSTTANRRVGAHLRPLLVGEEEEHGEEREQSVSL